MLPIRSSATSRVVSSQYLSMLQVFPTSHSNTSHPTPIIKVQKRVKRKRCPCDQGKEGAGKYPERNRTHSTRSPIKIPPRKWRSISYHHRVQYREKTMAALCIKAMTQTSRARMRSRRARDIAVV